MKNLPIVRLAAAALLAFAAPSWAADVDVTGVWAMAIETPMGTRNPVFELKQEGASITGKYQGQMGETPVSGTLNGSEITLTYEANAQGMQLEITYTGKVDGDTMSGTVNFGGMGEGSFTGTKKN